MRSDGRIEENEREDQMRTRAEATFDNLGMYVLPSVRTPNEKEPATSALVVLHLGLTENPAGSFGRRSPTRAGAGRLITTAMLIVGKKG
jgi:hypothetical protein